MIRVQLRGVNLFLPIKEQTKTNQNKPKQSKTKQNKAKQSKNKSNYYAYSFDSIHRVECVPRTCRIRGVFIYNSHLAA